MRNTESALFYFGVDNTSQTKDNTGVILLGMSIAAVAIGIVLTANDSGSEDDVRLGTDRAAGEGEDERRIREREGGRSREAAEETREYRSWKTMSDSEMLAYYKEHYEGLSRRKLQDIDPSFYQTLLIFCGHESLSISNAHGTCGPSIIPSVIGMQARHDPRVCSR